MAHPRNPRCDSCSSEHGRRDSSAYGATPGDAGRLSYLRSPTCANFIPKNQILGMDDRNNWNELQSNFCSVIIVSNLMSVMESQRSHLPTVCHPQAGSWDSAFGGPNNDPRSSIDPDSRQDVNSA